MRVYTEIWHTSLPLRAHVVYSTQKTPTGLNFSHRLVHEYEARSTRDCMALHVLHTDTKRAHRGSRRLSTTTSVSQKITWCCLTLPPKGPIELAGCTQILALPAAYTQARHHTMTNPVRTCSTAVRVLKHQLYYGTLLILATDAHSCSPIQWSMKGHFHMMVARRRPISMTRIC